MPSPPMEPPCYKPGPARSLQSLATPCRFSLTSAPLSASCRQVAPSVAKADYHSFNRMDWHPKGFHLAVPTRNNDVTFFERKEFAEAGRLKEGHLGDVSMVAYAPNGLYCLTVGMDQQVVVWDTGKKKQRKVLAQEKLSAFLAGAAWRRKDRSNAVGLFSHNGEVCLWNVRRLIPPAAGVGLGPICPTSRRNSAPAPSGSAVKSFSPKEY